MTRIDGVILPTRMPEVNVGGVAETLANLHRQSYSDPLGLLARASTPCLADILIESVNGEHADKLSE